MRLTPVLVYPPPRRGDFGKAAEYFKQASAAYSKAYGPTDRRVEEARKRCKAMLDKVGEQGGVAHTHSHAHAHIRGHA